MKNIFKIFISDVKRIFQNVVAVVVIMGLCVIPCLYAWFNIFSNWDPYGESSTSNLKVAVVSEDEGVTVAGISVNIGSSVVEALQENKVMGWVFTETSDEAVDGVYSGEYYAALVIPERRDDDRRNPCTGTGIHHFISRTGPSGAGRPMHGDCRKIRRRDPDPRCLPRPSGNLCRVRRDRHLCETADARQTVRDNAGSYLGIIPGAAGNRSGCKIPFPRS